MMSIARCAFALAAVLAGSYAPGIAQDMALPEPVGMNGNPAARSVLDGNAAFLRGDLAAARDDYHRALARKPDFAVATFNLGLVEVHVGQRTRGLADMDHGITLATTHRMSSTFVTRLRALRAAFAAHPADT